MKFIKEDVAGTAIYIQVSDEPIEVEEYNVSERSTKTTSVKSRVENMYTDTKEVIHNLAEDMGNNLANIKSESKPSKVEMELNIGFSAEAGVVWLLNAEGQAGLKVKFTWDLSK